MTTTKTIALAIASLSFLTLAFPALAQDKADSGRVLPEICKTGAMHHDDMGSMKTDMTGMKTDMAGMGTDMAGMNGKLDLLIQLIQNSGK